MYSYNPYRDAFEAGKIQSEILNELANEAESADDIDITLARQLIAERLAPYYDEHGVDLSF